MDDINLSEVILPKCRICTISSECFNYFDIFEKKIFNNIIVKDAVILITQLQISVDDGYPKWICCRCEQRLLDAYQFRKLAESSAKQFAATIPSNNRKRLVKSENPIKLHQISRDDVNDAATNNSENEVIDMIVYSKSNENNDEEQHSFNIVTGDDDDELVNVEYLNNTHRHEKPNGSESISPFSGFDEQSVIKYDYNNQQQQQKSNTSNLDDDYNDVEVVSIHDDENVGFEITVISTQETTPTPSKNLNSSNKISPRFSRKPTQKKEILTPRLSNRSSAIKKRTPVKVVNAEKYQNNKITIEKIQSLAVNPSSSYSDDKKNQTPTSMNDNAAEIDAVEYLIQKVEDLKQDGNVIRKSIKRQKLETPVQTTMPEPEIIKSKMGNSSVLYVETVPDPKRKYSCQVCAKRFVGKSNLIDHLRYHANVKPFKCDMCDRAFVQIGTLKSHLRTHTKEKPFVCHICQKAFSQNCSLKIHLRKHTKERNYVCQVCQKTFMSHCDLAKHSRIHDPSKRYSCEFCTKKFTQNCNLKKHIKTMHDGGIGGVGTDGSTDATTVTPPKKVVSPKIRNK